MKDHILSALLKQKKNAHTALPSLRQQAAFLNCSPNTVYKRYQELIRRKQIYRKEKVGFFWGEAPAEIEKQAIHSPRKYWQSYINPFEHDLISGTFSLDQPLPSIKQLSNYYHCSYHTIHKLIGYFVAQDVLIKKGRQFYLKKESHPSAQQTILLICACESNGQLKIDSERELTFIKSLKKQCAIKSIRLSILGFENRVSRGTFYKKNNAVTAQELQRNYLGVIISTWHVKLPLALIPLLPTDLPLAFWWEDEELPDRSLFAKHKFYSLFNLAYGIIHGQHIGQILIQKKYTKVLFFSPFHQSQWSQERLEGIHKANSSGQLTVETMVFTEIKNLWTLIDQMKNKLNGSSKAKHMLRKKISKVLKNNFPLEQYEAIICVNDESAILFKESLPDELKNMALNFISFDNDTSSYIYQFDSYEFNTEAMVNDMILSILEPKNPLFKNQFILSPLGKLIEK